MENQALKPVEIGRETNSMKEGVRNDPNFLLSVIKGIMLLFAELGKS